MQRKKERTKEVSRYVPVLGGHTLVGSNLSVVVPVSEHGIRTDSDFQNWNKILFFLLNFLFSRIRHRTGNTSLIFKTRTIILFFFKLKNEKNPIPDCICVWNLNPKRLVICLFYNQNQRFFTKVKNQPILYMYTIYSEHRIYISFLGVEIGTYFDKHKKEWVLLICEQKVKLTDLKHLGII